MWTLFNKASATKIIDPASFPRNHSGFEANSRHIAQFSARANVVRPGRDTLTPAYGAELYDKLCRLIRGKKGVQSSAGADEPPDDDLVSLLRMKSLREILRLSLIDEKHIVAFLRHSHHLALLDLIRKEVEGGEPYSPSPHIELTFRILSTWWARSLRAREVLFQKPPDALLTTFEVLIDATLRLATPASLSLLGSICFHRESSEGQAPVGSPLAQASRTRTWPVLKRQGGLERLLGLLRDRSSDAVVVNTVADVVAGLMSASGRRKGIVADLLALEFPTLLKDLVDKYCELLGEKKKEEADPEAEPDDDIKDIRQVSSATPERALGSLIHCVAEVSKDRRARVWVVERSKLHASVVGLAASHIKRRREISPRSFCSPSTSIGSLVNHYVSALMFLSLHDDVKKAVADAPEFIKEVSEWVIREGLPVGIRAGCCQVLSNCCPLRSVREELMRGGVVASIQGVLGKGEDNVEFRDAMKRLLEKIQWVP